MPELAEVETVRRGLQAIVGQRIMALKVSDKGIRSLGGLSLADLSDTLISQEFLEINRQGKFLIFMLNKSAVVAHLRMTGRFIISDSSVKYYPPELLSDGDSSGTNYIRISLYLSNSILHFADKRRFGTFHLITDKSDLDNYPSLKRLGPDAISDQFTSQYLANRLSNSTRPIYTALLDQSVTAGLGNIYVCEALFSTRISPTRQANQLSNNELEQLVSNIKLILQLSIQNQGTSFSDYTNTDGNSGLFQNMLKVYAQTEVKVADVNYKVITKKIGGRRAHYVPELQV